MEKEFEIDKRKRIIKIGNKYYRLEEDLKTGQIKTIPIKPKRLEKMVNEIADYLISKIDKKEILVDAIYELSLEEIEGIYKRLFKAKRKPKIKKKNGCIELQVGSFWIPIR